MPPTPCPPHGPELQLWLKDSGLTRMSGDLLNIAGNVAAGQPIGLAQMVSCDGSDLLVY